MSRGAWLIIAGILLLGHTPALAKPKILIIKKGGVYHITSPEQPRSNQAGRPTPSLQWLPYNPQARPTFPVVKSSIPEADQPHNLLPRLFKAVTRLTPGAIFKPPLPKGSPVGAS